LFNPHLNTVHQPQNYFLFSEISKDKVKKKKKKKNQKQIGRLFLFLPIPNSNLLALISVFFLLFFSDS